MENAITATAPAASTAINTANNIAVRRRLWLWLSSFGFSWTESNLTESALQGSKHAVNSTFTQVPRWPGEVRNPRRLSTRANTTNTETYDSSDEAIGSATEGGRGIVRVGWCDTKLASKQTS